MPHGVVAGSMLIPNSAAGPYKSPNSLAAYDPNKQLHILSWGLKNGRPAGDIRPGRFVSHKPSGQTETFGLPPRSTRVGKAATQQGMG